MPSTAAEQEAKRRSGRVASPGRRHVFEDGFTQGAEWALEPYMELLEAAREYRDELAEVGVVVREDDSVTRLLAAATALNEEGAHDAND